MRIYTIAEQMNVYRIHSGLDVFEINGAYLPYLDVIADGPIHAVIIACMLMPDMDGKYSNNNISGNPEFINNF